MHPAITAGRVSANPASIRLGLARSLCGIRSLKGVLRSPRISRGPRGALRHPAARRLQRCRKPPALDKVRYEDFRFCLVLVPARTVSLCGPLLAFGNRIKSIL
jgi:hypothetical protein